MFLNDLVCNARLGLQCAALWLIRYAWHFQSRHSLMAILRRDWRARNNAIAAVHPPGHMSSPRRSRDKNTTPRNQRRLTHRGVTIMNTKTKLALAAALVVGTTSFAAADGYDPNLANRYPAYAKPVAAAPHVSAHQNRTFRSAPVGLYQGRNVQLNNQRWTPTTTRPRPTPAAATDRRICVPPEPAFPPRRFTPRSSRSPRAGCFRSGRSSQRVNRMQHYNCALQHGCHAVKISRFTTVSAIHHRALAKALLHCNITPVWAPRFVRKTLPPGCAIGRGATSEQPQETQCLNL